MNTLPWQYSRAGCFYTPDTSGLFLGAGSCSTDMMSMPLPPLSYQAFWRSFLSSSYISGQCCCDILVSSTWQRSWRMSSWAPLGDTQWPSMSGLVQCLITEEPNNKTSITNKTVSLGLTKDSTPTFDYHILIKYLNWYIWYSVIHICDCKRHFRYYLRDGNLLMLLATRINILAPFMWSPLFTWIWIIKYQLIINNLYLKILTTYCNQL